MGNKSDLDTLSMDDLYNNLKVYEFEIKGQSSSSSNSQNVAFVSFDNTSSTNETANTTHNVSAASSKDQASTASYNDDDVMFYFFSNQSNALQTGLGYDGHVNKHEVLNNVVDRCECDGDDNQVNDRFKKSEGYHIVSSPYTRNYMPPKADLSFAGLDYYVFKSKLSETITSVSKIEINASKTTASVSTARHVNNVASRPNVNIALPKTYSYFKAHSPDQGIFDSGCSRHMTENKSYLIDYQEIDGGFVAFGGNAKG
nr:hypothetical protein [Tanacetum cinerariifolium]